MLDPALKEILDKLIKQVAPVGEVNPAARKVLESIVDVASKDPRAVADFLHFSKKAADFCENFPFKHTDDLVDEMIKLFTYEGVTCSKELCLKLLKALNFSALICTATLVATVDQTKKENQKFVASIAAFALMGIKLLKEANILEKALTLLSSEDACTKQATRSLFE